VTMESWYRIVQQRTEVSASRSFNPDEFAIALEQVVAGTAPEDYKDAGKFFARTCFTLTLGGRHRRSRAPNKDRISQ
jgi:hypothetical protein